MKATQQQIDKLIKAGASSKGVRLPVESDLESTVDLTFYFPWPVSLNQAYRHLVVKERPITLLSGKGRKYRDEIVKHVLLQSPRRTPISGFLRVVGVFHEPDKRRRDIDGVAKLIFDGMTHAGVYYDDSQIRHMDMRFGCVKPGGQAIITLSRM